MLFAEMTALAARLRSTSSRSEKTALVAGYLLRLEPAERRSAVAFLGARPFPASDPRTLDASFGLLKEAGAGTAPESATLSIEEVAAAFSDIASATGAGSRKAKIERFAALFGRATEPERRLIAEIVFGELRTGFQEGMLPEAIAKAAGVPVRAVRRAAMFLYDLSEVAAIALGPEPEASLARVGIRLFAPVMPMLAEPAKGVEDALAQHGGRTSLEWKYDGVRLQIHVKDGEARAWSRRMTELTASIPDVLDDVKRTVGAREAILDGEVVGVAADGKPLPFQEVMRRMQRTREVEDTARDVPLLLHLFDCLFLDGRSLVDEPYEARWEALAKATAGAMLARRLATGRPEEAAALLREALAAGHEGLMAKEPGSPYEPGRRGKRWLKIKVPDTVDCVIVAADRGSGRRKGWLSNLHLAVRDADGGWAHVGKTFKGLTDAELATMTARLQAIATKDDGYTVSVRPEIVVEVTYNDIQRSPRYRSKLALRFARVTAIRDDRRPEDATTLEELAARYERQFETKGR